MFKTAITTHGFNFPMQIGNIGDPRLGRMQSDTSKDAIVESIAIEDGDIVVMGSDGLWDNIFDTEIESILNSSAAGVVKIDELLTAADSSEESCEAVKNVLDTTVKAIAMYTQKAYSSKTKKTPWSESVLKHYKSQRYAGGKSDDLTIIVTYFKKETVPTK